MPQVPHLLLQGRPVCLLLRGVAGRQESGWLGPQLRSQGSPVSPRAPWPPCHLLQVVLQLSEHGLQVRDLLGQAPGFWPGDMEVRTQGTGLGQHHGWYPDPPVRGAQPPSSDLRCTELPLMRGHDTGRRVRGRLVGGLLSIRLWSSWAPCSGMGCPVGTEGPFGTCAKRAPLWLLHPDAHPYPRSTLVASPSRRATPGWCCKWRQSRDGLPLVFQGLAASLRHDCGQQGGLSQGKRRPGSLPLAPRPPPPPLLQTSFLLIEFLRDKVRGKKEWGPQLWGWFVLPPCHWGCLAPSWGGGSSR